MPKNDNTTKKTQKKTVTQNYMDSIPMRADLPWREREDGIVEIDMEHKGFYNGIAQKFFKKPRVSHIALDRYGTVVWNSMDGAHSVYDIVQLMEETFPEEKERMLDRVVTYMGTLQRSGFLIFRNDEA